MTLKGLENQKIAIVGLGVNNKNLAKYLESNDINFEVIDNWQGSEELVGKLDNFDIIFRTPGLPVLSKAFEQARQKGVKIYSQTKLFFDLCPCPIIGVTGTKGKGTTASLIFEICKMAGKKAWLAGNIGQDPFEFIEKLAADDIVILELSSFQLQDLEKSPHVAVVLQITSEHQDYHQSISEYVAAKEPIVSHQLAEDYAIFNYDNEITRRFAKSGGGQIVWNSIDQEVTPGCFVKNDGIILAWDGKKQEVLKISEVKLLGRFNLENVTAAIAASRAAGITQLAAMRQAVSKFRGLHHRLEFVEEIRGVKFYNDSLSTTPETAIAALSVFTSPVILIIGGSEKNADYRSLAQAIAAAKIRALLPIGTTGPEIAKFARQAGFSGRIVDRNLFNMEKIVNAANDLAVPQDVVLLSPASASFDMFKDYKQRGELFKKFVLRLDK